MRSNQITSHNTAYPSAVNNKTVTFRGINDDVNRLIATMSGSERTNITFNTD